MTPLFAVFETFDRLPVCLGFKHDASYSARESYAYFFFQICYNVNGKQVLMSSPGVLEPYLFSKLMTEKEIRERISLTPNAPCLNLK